MMTAKGSLSFSAMGNLITRDNFCMTIKLQFATKLTYKEMDWNANCFWGHKCFQISLKMYHIPKT